MTAILLTEMVVHPNVLLRLAIAAKMVVLLLPQLVYMLEYQFK